MKLYNANIDKIENLKVFTALDGSTMYTGKATDEELNAVGYYKLEYQSVPNRRYYNTTPTSSLISNKWTIGYTQVDKDIGEIHTSMLNDLKIAFNGYAERPVVDTGLGYSVDGGRKDLENFAIGKEFGFPAVKDADGNMQMVTSTDYDTISTAIKTAGVTLYQVKWAKEAEIKSFTTVAECVLYEATPYSYTITAEDVLNNIDGSLVEGDIVTRHTNNVKEW